MSIIAYVINLLFIFTYAYVIYSYVSFDGLVKAWSRIVENYI
jgi:hypothetical protein